MSDIAESSAKPSSKRDERTDKQAFAQVEKWMAMIREIDQDRQPEPKRAVERPLRPTNDTTESYKMNRLRSAFLARSPICFCT